MRPIKQCSQVHSATEEDVVAGVGLQVLQQLAGINTVMYFTPAILELAGIHNNRVALLVRPGSAVHRRTLPHYQCIRQPRSTDLSRLPVSERPPQAAAQPMTGQRREGMADACCQSESAMPLMKQRTARDVETVLRFCAIAGGFGTCGSERPRDCGGHAACGPLWAKVH